MFSTRQFKQTIFKLTNHRFKNFQFKPVRVLKCICIIINIIFVYV